MNYRILTTLFLFLAVITHSRSKCTNSSQFKYSLKQPSDLLGHHSICSEFSRRTCCSENDFEQITKRLGKIFGGKVELSPACRVRLTHSLCSVCDGDVGEQRKEGVCHKYCLDFYRDCSQEYFVFDTNKQLRVCKEDDIICSKLKYIIGSSPKQKTCELFGLTVGKRNCWAGEVSGDLRGPAKNKIRSASKVKTHKSKDNFWSVINDFKMILIPTGLALLFWLIWMWKSLKKQRELWKRQIRNM